MVKFRFQDFKIWQLAIEIADELFDIADEIEKKRLYRVAEQLRSAGMSMSNNLEFRNLDTLCPLRSALCAFPFSIKTTLCRSRLHPTSPCYGRI